MPRFSGSHRSRMSDLVLNVNPLTAVTAPDRVRQRRSHTVAVALRGDRESQLLCPVEGAGSRRTIIAVVTPCRSKRSEPVARYRNDSPELPNRSVSWLLFCVRVLTRVLPRRGQGGVLVLLHRGERGAGISVPGRRCSSDIEGGAECGQVEGGVEQCVVGGGADGVAGDDVEGLQGRCECR